MNKIAAILPILALAACGQEPAPAPEPTPTVAAPAQPKLPAPSQEVFAGVFASTCPAAEKVATAVCKRVGGMGGTDVSCEFGVGEDKNLRHKATLTPGDGEWKLADAEAICAEHDSHHVAS